MEKGGKIKKKSHAMVYGDFSLIYSDISILGQLQLLQDKIHNSLSIFGISILGIPRIFFSRKPVSVFSTTQNSNSFRSEL